MTIEVGKFDNIDIDSIEIINRAREVLGDLDSLEASMKESGLISPFAVMALPDGRYRLLAGERRWTVLKRNNVTAVPVRIYTEELTELQIKVIEKSENFHRKDMEYYEFDQLTTEIHNLQQELVGVKGPGPGQEGWGTRDTAKLIGAKSPATVTEAVRRTEAREAFPELFEKCKTASDASKVLKKVDVAVVKHAIVQKLKNNKANVTIHDFSKRFIIKSFFEGVKEIPDSSMHLVEIDPPYSIDLMNKKQKTGESMYQVSDYNEVPTSIYMDGDPESDWKGMHTVFKESYRVMAQHSWIICWFGMDWYSEIKAGLDKAGFTVTNICGIWNKKASGQSNQPAIYLGNSYETFIYARKGSPALNKPGRSNMFEFPPVYHEKKTHPTERPPELMLELYDTFAFAGSRVLVPFLGSGIGLIAAQELKLEALGFELSKAYKDSFLVKVNSL